uniref:type I protein arginine methyltransferase n=1 Tax=Polytomella parva TaxID=51329 RepID=A0A7S0VD07_9CHLO|mmetsp:Transcript_4088/g.7273  ORF Transcript_4088/g.7273 Transcript_4088/m.7273 type:complete len:1243 (+) Transcript_4088:11-3739(+)
MFVQRRNPLTGDTDWVLVDEPGLGTANDASAELVATSSYLDMLTDFRRNEAYHRALRRTLRPETRVLDIGTGTGLLSMLAARSLQRKVEQKNVLPENGSIKSSNGNSEKAEVDSECSSSLDSQASHRVYGCEVFPPMQNLSRRVVAHNNLSHMIKILPKRSDEIQIAPDSTSDEEDRRKRMLLETPQEAVARRRAELLVRANGGISNDNNGGGNNGNRNDKMKYDMPEKADVIVTEIFDSQLLGEGMIPSMRHAARRLLKDDGEVIPASGKLFGQLVKSPLLRAMSGLVPGARERPIQTSSGPLDVSYYGIEADRRVFAALAALDARARVLQDEQSDEMYDANEIHVDGSRAFNMQYVGDACAHARLYDVPDSQFQSTDEGEGESKNVLMDPMSDPFEIFHFDWRNPPMHRHVDLKVPITGSGFVDGMLIWWQLDMDGRLPPLLLSTAPFWIQDDPSKGGDGGTMSKSILAVEGDDPRHSQDTLLEQGNVRKELDLMDMDDETLAPQNLRQPQRWRDHWKQCWSQLAGAPLFVTDSLFSSSSSSSSSSSKLNTAYLNLEAEHDEVSIRFRAVGGVHYDQVDVAGFCSSANPSPGAIENSKEGEWEESANAMELLPLHTLMSANSLLLLNCAARRKPFAASIARAIYKLVSNRCTIKCVADPSGMLKHTTRASTTGGVSATPIALQAREENDSITSLRNSSSRGRAFGISSHHPKLQIVVVDGSLTLGLTAAAAYQELWRACSRCEGGSGLSSREEEVEAKVEAGTCRVTLLRDASAAMTRWTKAATKKALRLEEEKETEEELRGKGEKRTGVDADKKGNDVNESFEDNVPSSKSLTDAQVVKEIPTPTVKSQKKQLFIKSLKKKAADAIAPDAQKYLLLAEPLFSEFDSSLPWTHLRVWHDFSVIRQALREQHRRALEAAKAEEKDSEEKRKQHLEEEGEEKSLTPNLQFACIPARAKLMAVAVSLPDLWRSRQALSTVEGLDLTPCNAGLGVVGGGDEAHSSENKGNDDDGYNNDDKDKLHSRKYKEITQNVAKALSRRSRLPMLPYNIWQCGGGYEELSERVEVLNIDLTQDIQAEEGDGLMRDSENEKRREREKEGTIQSSSDQSCSKALGHTVKRGVAELMFKRQGDCHAVVLWVDYDLDPEGEFQIQNQPPVLQTGRKGNADSDSKGNPKCDESQGRDLPSGSIQGIFLLPETKKVEADEQGCQTNSETINGVEKKWRLFAEFNAEMTDLEVEVQFG